MSTHRLQLDAVEKVFEGPQPVHALGPISLSLAENEFVSVVGTSGCGKSTMLMLAAGLTEPSAGEILVDGEPIRGAGRDRGVVFQTYTLFPWMTARANVEFALRGGHRMGSAERRRVALEHLDLVGLSRYADAYPRQLSGGMK